MAIKKRYLKRDFSNIEKILCCNLKDHDTRLQVQNDYNHIKAEIIKLWKEEDIKMLSDYIWVMRLQGFLFFLFLSTYLCFPDFLEYLQLQTELCPSNAYVEALISNVLVFGEGSFGR